MSTKTAGFTIIELLSVILILGILVTIASASWNGLTTWSQNGARGNELRQWSSAFDLYKSKYAVYPYTPTADGTTTLCLGDFPKTSNKCGEYTSSTSGKVYNATTGTDGTNATTIRTELARVGKIPTNSAPPLDSTAIGPYAIFTQATSGPTVTQTVKLVAILKDNKCPSDTIKEAPSFSPIAQTLSQAVSCSITKTLTYNP